MKFHLKTVSYIVNKPFGRYYIPARYQYVILRDYFKNNNTLFSLPQGEPAFSKTSIRLRTIIKNLNRNDSLILLKNSETTTPPFFFQKKFGIPNN